MSRSRIPQAVVDHPVQGRDARRVRRAAVRGGRHRRAATRSRTPSGSPAHRPPYLDRVVRNGIPALIVSGWHDVYQRGAVLDFARLQNAWSRLHGGPGRPASDSPPMTADQAPTPRYQRGRRTVVPQPDDARTDLPAAPARVVRPLAEGDPRRDRRTSTPLHVFELRRRPLDRRRALAAAADATAHLLPRGRRARIAAPPGAGTDTLTWSDVRSPCNAGHRPVEHRAARAGDRRGRRERRPVRRQRRDDAGRRAHVHERAVREPPRPSPARST